MRDASGQMYMRNRYYDPATGQFTQPDPIGIAGGLNSYGFAAGDPVSYADPYGLCPKEMAEISPLMCTGYDIMHTFAHGPTLPEEPYPGSGMAGDAGSLDPVPYIAATLSGGAGSFGIRTLNPRSIRFSQSSIRSTFKDEGDIFTLAEGLRSGAINPADIPAIRLVERDGKLFTLDNRRLAAFHLAEVPVPYRMATPAEIEAEAWKFTTKNGGSSINVRDTGGTVP